jgi:hypothetical protein
MRTIVKNAPIFDRSTTVPVDGSEIRVKPDQIIVWISISAIGSAESKPRVPVLPAILDTGCNHNLLISERHLRGWAVVDPGSLRRLRNVRVMNQVLGQYAASVWLYPNRSNSLERSTSGQPFSLELSGGIAVVPAHDRQDLYPRLPLLGLRAFRPSGLRIAVDCHRSTVTIRTRRQFWPFR